MSKLEYKLNVSSGTSGLALALFLSGCSGVSDMSFAFIDKDFSEVSTSTKEIVGYEVKFLRDESERQRLSDIIDDLTGAKSVDMDTAVKIAILNNKDVQNSLADVGIAAIKKSRSTSPQNPKFSVGVLGIGSAELGAYKALETLIHVDVSNAINKNRTEVIAHKELQQAKLAAVLNVLRVTEKTKKSWINSVYAFETLELIKNAKETADASAELAEKLGQTGAITKAEQAKHFVFDAALSADLAKAEVLSRNAKLELAQVLGLANLDEGFFVPDVLPKLPAEQTLLTDNMNKITEDRLDLKIMRQELEMAAEVLGIAANNSVLSNMELVIGLEKEREKHEGQIKSEITPSAEFEFTIPIFKYGKRKRKEAEFNYLKIANDFSKNALDAKAEIKSVRNTLQASYYVARQYEDHIVPLRRTIEEEALLSYNGMITSTFELILAVRERLDADLQNAKAKRDFFLARANAATAQYGPGMGSNILPGEIGMSGQSGEEEH